MDKVDNMKTNKIKKKIGRRNKMKREEMNFDEMRLNNP